MCLLTHTIVQAQQAGGTGPGDQLAASSSPQAPSADQYGLLGLLTVISMSDADVTTLALGTDLTTLGLHLNGVEPVYDTFASPWADYPLRPDPDFKVQHTDLHPPARSYCRSCLCSLPACCPGHVQAVTHPNVEAQPVSGLECQNIKAAASAAYLPRPSSPPSVEESVLNGADRCRHTIGTSHHVCTRGT